MPRRRGLPPSGGNGVGVRPLRGATGRHSLERLAVPSAYRGLDLVA